MSRRRRKTTKDTFTSAGLRAQSGEFRTTIVPTVWLPNSAARYGQQHCHSLTSQCCRLHTNISERDDSSSVTYTYVACDVVALCQFPYANAAYGSYVTVCTHVLRTALHWVAVGEAATGVPTAAWSLIIQFVMFGFKIPPCSDCGNSTFEWLLYFWILYTDVSEHSVCSIVLGGGSRVTWLG